MMQNGDAISNQQVQAVVVSDEGDIQALIKSIRGVQVILDRDVARLYGVTTGALNRQVKRNAERFPEDFMFRLSAEEWDNLKCQKGVFYDGQLWDARVHWPRHAHLLKMVTTI